MAQTFTIYVLRDYLEVSDYGGEAIKVYNATVGKAFFFDDGSGTPTFPPPDDLIETVAVKISSDSLSDAAGLYALCHALDDALDSEGYTVTYTPVGGVLQEAWDIVFASDILGSDVDGKSIYLYAPAQPRGAINAVLVESMLNWYNAAPDSIEANPTYFSGTPSGTYYAGILSGNAVLIETTDDAFLLAEKTRTVINAMDGPTNSQEWEAAIKVATGTRTIEIDTTTLDVSASIATGGYWRIIVGNADAQGRLTTEENYHAWLSLDGSGTPQPGADGTVEIAVVTGDDAEDIKDKLIAAINSSFGTKMTASSLSTNVLQVVPDSPLDFIFSWAFGLTGSDLTCKLDGSEAIGDVTLEVECINPSPTPAWTKHPTDGPGAKLTLTQVTAGTYHADDHLISVDFGAEMAAVPEHLTTDDSDLLLDEIPADVDEETSADAECEASAECTPVVDYAIALDAEATASADCVPDLDLVAQALLYGSRVEETATCSGTTGHFILAGAITDHRTFAQEIGSVIETEYYATATGKWERGLGIYYAGKVYRKHILGSSTGSAISWTGSETINLRVVRGPSWLSPVRHLTAAAFPYTADAEDGTLIVDPGDSAVTLTLPVIRGKGYRVRIADDFSGSGSVAVADAGGTLLTLDAAGEWSDFQRDMDDWSVYSPGMSSVPDGDKGDITVSSSGATWTIDDGVLTVAKFHADAIVVESDTIALNDNDTTLPTSAAVKAYVDAYFPVSAANGGTGHTTGARERLTANRTYYVDKTNGSDSNNGLSAGSGNAFQTTAKAISVVCDTLDRGIYDVVIQHADDTYTIPIVLKNGIGTGEITLRGNTTTPANCKIQTTSADAISGVNVFTHWNIEGFEIQTTTSGRGIIMEGGQSFLHISGNMRFVACAQHHIQANNGAVVEVEANYTVAGGALSHWCFTSEGMIKCQVKTVTISGTPAFSLAWAFGTQGGGGAFVGNTFSGSATGTRYTLLSESWLDTNGAGATYLPGNAGGSGSNYF